MGFLSALFGSSNSTPTSLLQYCTYKSGQIRTAREYASVFNDALTDLCKRRTDDKYLQDILFDTLGKVYAAKECCSYAEEHDGHCNKWHVYYGGGYREDRSITLELSTPNAVQRNFDGNVVSRGSHFSITYEDILNNSGQPRYEYSSRKRKRGCGCWVGFLVLVGVVAGLVYWFLR